MAAGSAAHLCCLHDCYAVIWIFRIECLNFPYSFVVSKSEIAVDNMLTLKDYVYLVWSTGCNLLTNVDSDMV